MKNPISMELDLFNANRNNTGMALKRDMHYDLSKLIEISGADFEGLIRDLQWCAENHEDEMALSNIQHFAEALLSAYEIQRESYD